jgi:hypothetical protein
MPDLESCPPFDGPPGGKFTSANPFEPRSAELFDHAEYAGKQFGPALTPAAVTLTAVHHHIKFTGGGFVGGTATCEEILGATHICHDGTRYERGSARNDVVITAGAAHVTWQRCPGLRWIVAGGFCERDRAQTGPRVRNCEVMRAPLGEIAVVVCLNSEPFSGDVVNLRLPWRWLHFKFVDGYFWLRRRMLRSRAASAAAR